MATADLKRHGAILVQKFWREYRERKQSAGDQSEKKSHANVKLIKHSRDEVASSISKTEKSKSKQSLSDAQKEKTVQEAAKPEPATGLVPTAPEGPKPEESGPTESLKKTKSIQSVKSVKKSVSGDELSSPKLVASPQSADQQELARTESVRSIAAKANMVRAASEQFKKSSEKMNESELKRSNSQMVKSEVAKSATSIREVATLLRAASEKSIRSLPKSNSQFGFHSLHLSTDRLKDAIVKQKVGKDAVSQEASADNIASQDIQPQEVTVNLVRQPDQEAIIAAVFDNTPYITKSVVHCKFHYSFCFSLIP